MNSLRNKLYNRGIFSKISNFTTTKCYILRPKRFQNIVRLQNLPIQNCNLRNNNLILTNVNQNKTVTPIHVDSFSTCFLQAPFERSRHDPTPGRERPNLGFQTAQNCVESTHARASACRCSRHLSHNRVRRMRNRDYCPRASSRASRSPSFSLICAICAAIESWTHPRGKVVIGPRTAVVLASVAKGRNEIGRMEEGGEEKRQ